MRKSLMAANVALLAALPGLAWAEQPIETYQARLSNADHFSSAGTRLNGVAEVIRQDRANFYKFDLRDPEDQPDTLFKNEDNRLRLEDLIAHGNLSPDARDAILYG